MLLKVLGALLIAWGVVDFCMGNFMNVDVWREWLGIDLYGMSPLVWQYIAWVSIFAGAFLWFLGSPDEDEPDTPQG